MSIGSLWLTSVKCNRKVWCRDCVSVFANSGIKEIRWPRNNTAYGRGEVVSGENVSTGVSIWSNNANIADVQQGIHWKRVWLGTDSITGCLIRLSVISSVCIVKLDFHQCTLTCDISHTIMLPNWRYLLLPKKISEPQKNMAMFDL